MIEFLNQSERQSQTQVWQHQIEAARRISNHFQDKNNPRTALCVLPTGAGKSGIAVLSAYACNANRVLIITPSEEISNQLHNDFCNIRGSFLVRTGIACSEDFRLSLQPVTQGVVRKTSQIENAFNCVNNLIIANAHKFNSLRREEEEEVFIYDLRRDIDLVIVDEAHHYPAATWRHIVDHFNNANKIFLTATPEYKGGPILTYPHRPNFQHECTCYTISRETLIERRVIRPVVFNNLPGLDYLVDDPFDIRETKVYQVILIYTFAM